MTTGRDDPLGNAIRAILSPKPPEPTATPRVAVLNPGDGTLKQVLEDAGLEVVYEHTPKGRNDKLDFQRIPVFDLIAANISEDSGEVNKILELVARFLYVRRPSSFLLVGAVKDPAVVSAVHVKTWRMGYHLASGDAGLGAGGSPSQNTIAFMVGALERSPVPWHLGLIPSADGDKKLGEGQDEPLDKYAEIFRWQEIDEPPTLTLEDVAKAVTRHSKRDAPYFDDK